MNLNELDKELVKIKGNKHLSESTRKVLINWDKELTINEVKPISRLNYLKMMRYFFESVKKDHKELKREDLVNYLAGLSEKNKVRTINTKKICLKTFFKWLGKKNLIKWIKVSNKGLENIDPDKIINREDLAKLLGGCYNERDRALLMCLFESTARCKAFRNIKVGDLKEDEDGDMTLKLLDKGDKERVVLLSDAVPFIKAWLESHPFRNEKDFEDRPLFLTGANGHRGEKFSHAGLRNWVMYLKKRTNFEKKLHIHLFRKSRITELALMGLNEMQIRKISGWSDSSKMVGVYCRLADQDVSNKLKELNGKKVEKEKEYKKTKMAIPTSSKELRGLKDKRNDRLDRIEKTLEILLDRMTDDQVVKAAKQSSSSQLY